MSRPIKPRLSAAAEGDDGLKLLLDIAPGELGAQRARKRMEIIND